MKDLKSLLLTLALIQSVVSVGLAVLGLVLLYAAFSSFLREDMVRPYCAIVTAIAGHALWTGRKMEK